MRLSTGEARDEAGAWYEPGSAEAEAAADALLVPARACGRRIAHCLREGALAARPPHAGLLRLAGEIRLSCAYYTQVELPRLDRRRACAGPDGFSVELTFEDVLDRDDLLAGAAAPGLVALAESLGLTGREAVVWVLRVRGETTADIALLTGIPRRTVRDILTRAYRTVNNSWLASLYEDVQIARTFLRQNALPTAL